MSESGTALPGVLLTDDNPANLQVLFATLKDGDYKLLVAKDGKSALAIIRKARPDLVLLDIMMPGMDGYEVCRQIKADPEIANTSVIFLSALSETSDKVKGFEMGAVDYISKPFQPEEVVARVNTHLKIRQLESSLSSRNAELEEINAQIRRDLSTAARVQQALLPQTLPQSEKVSFAWRYQPCEELAGDSLHIMDLGENRFGMWILDACGHGVSSALLAVSVAHYVGQQITRCDVSGSQAQGLGELTPSEVASAVNISFPMAAFGGLYFTFLYAVYDATSGSLSYVSAGNPGPIRVSAGERRASVHDAPAVPAGMFADSEYQTSEIKLEAGDRVYLHSDGLHEERNADGEEFGRDRLCRLLEEHLDKPLDETVELVMQRVADWGGSDHLRDDAALVAMEVSAS